MNVEIYKEKLLAVEGKDEQKVFEVVLKEQGIENVQVVPVGGKTQFYETLNVMLKGSGAENLTSLALIRDADTNADSAFDSLKGVLSRLKKPVPKSPGEFVEKSGLRIGVFLMPGGKKAGMLEDLFLETIRNTPLDKCADIFIESLKEHYPPLPNDGEEQIVKFALSRNISKAKLQAVLIATKKPFKDLGITSEKGYWDFGNPAFSDLIEFLRAI